MARDHHLLHEIIGRCGAVVFVATPFYLVVRAATVVRAIVAANFGSGGDDTRRAGMGMGASARRAPAARPVNALGGGFREVADHGLLAGSAHLVRRRARGVAG